VSAVTDLAELERATYRVLAHYTRSIDSKNWVALGEVFADDCIKQRLGLDGLSGEVLKVGGAHIIADLSASLGACGPTQHLLGNHVVSLSGGDEVESLTYVRAFHRGAGSNAQFWLDVVGEYRVRWRQAPAGWRVTSWCLQIFNAVGDPRAVAPES
jgi:hypothetical protein